MSGRSEFISERSERHFGLFGREWKMECLSKGLALTENDLRL